MEATLSPPCRYACASTHTTGWNRLLSCVTSTDFTPSAGREPNGPYQYVCTSTRRSTSRGGVLGCGRYDAQKDAAVGPLPPPLPPLPPPMPPPMPPLLLGAFLPASSPAPVASICPRRKSLELLSASKNRPTSSALNAWRREPHVELSQSTSGSRRLRRRESASGRTQLRCGVPGQPTNSKPAARRRRSRLTKHSAWLPSARTMTARSFSSKPGYSSKKRHPQASQSETTTLKLSLLGSSASAAARLALRTGRMPWPWRWYHIGSAMSSALLSVEPIRRLSLLYTSRKIFPGVPLTTAGRIEKREDVELRFMLRRPHSSGFGSAHTCRRGSLSSWSTATQPKPTLPPK
mmetsp:Transcript_43583/g.90948  ORF Transcript_43583/g.90948 Transcript_43583/m.90948 type:complete len:348 (-) Transcript_43583:410-1453(-)